MGDGYCPHCVDYSEGYKQYIEMVAEEDKDGNVTMICPICGYFERDDDPGAYERSVDDLLRRYREETGVKTWEPDDAPPDDETTK